jgi:hypothetical protein
MLSGHSGVGAGKQKPGAPASTAIHWKVEPISRLHARPPQLDAPLPPIQPLAQCILLSYIKSLPMLIFMPMALAFRFAALLDPPAGTTNPSRTLRRL